ncbi:MAG: DUF4290 domain-containing protein [Alloprevotella sp.]|nr:DUF4290 domain-containing protein [Alloprevotella sp.]
MDYNTQREKLRLPEYGRLVQQMAEYAMTIENREQRQRYAEHTVRVMGHLNPKMKGVPDYQHKLWDHLAYITDYKLDIDYPVEIQRRDTAQRPPRLEYPQAKIRHRHYGHLLEKALEQIGQMPAGKERDLRTYQIANRMKRNLAAWKGDGATDDKVARDIEAYTAGAIQI